MSGPGVTATPARRTDQPHTPGEEEDVGQQHARRSPGRRGRRRRWRRRTSARAAARARSPAPGGAPSARRRRPARARRRRASPTTRALPQPQSWPLTMPSDSRPTPATSRTMPRTSGSGPGCSSRLSRSSAPRRDQRRQADGEVDEEDPAPARRRRRARRRARVRSAAAMPPVAPQRAVAVARCSSGNSGSSSASEVGTRIAAPAACTTRARDEHLDRRRQPADDRSGEEGRDADEEHPPPAETIGQPARRHQQRGEDDVVGVEDPGEARRATCRGTTPRCPGRRC